MDENDMRSQMAANKRQKSNGQIMFFGALVAIPVLGLIGGLLMKSSNPKVEQPIAVTEAAGPEQDAFSQLSVGKQYLTLMAQDDKILAASLYLGDEYPDLLKENAFRAVLLEIHRCASTYELDNALSNMQEHYRSTNLNNYMKSVERIERYGSAEALKKLLADRHQREVMNIALNPVRKVQFLIEVEALKKDMENIEETVSQTQMSYAQCVALKKLIGQGKLNLNRL